jgi:ATP-binding cassette subfamily B protein
MNATPAPHVSTKRIFEVFGKQSKKYTPQIILIVFCLVVISALTAIVPIFYKNFFDALAAGDKGSAAFVALVWGLSLKGVIIVLWRPVGFFSAWVQTRAMVNLSSLAFSRVLGHSYDFFTNSFVGSLTRKVNRFAHSYEVIFDQLVSTLVPLFVSTSVMFVVIFYRSKEIAMFIGAWFLVLLYINYIAIKWKQKYEIERAEADSKVGGTVSDSLGNNIAVKIFTGFVHEGSLVGSVLETLRKKRLFTANINEVIKAVQAALSIFIEVVVMVASYKLYQAGALTIGDFVLFQTYIISLSHSLWGIGWVLKVLYQSFADAREMVEIIDKPYDVQDVPGAKELVVTHGEIEFKDVVFNFNETRTVLDGFDLSIAPGEKIAFVGSSGAGKSTLTKLLFRFYDVTGGMITVDGQDISKVTQESLRDAISLVPQEPILFHRSLKENIAYGRRDATDEEIVDAAKRAHCHDFISQLPDGYDTLVGERGVKLSGGERQRVAIARAILKDAPILVLDEATSSLDSESEHLIQDALKTLMEGKTVIVIAHRLSTINTMDRIIVVEDGKVRAMGTHGELLSHDEVYKKFWDIQAGGFIGEGE